MQFYKKGVQGEVYDRLLDFVFSGKVEPGTKLVERDLADQLGVSRIPVRESLSKLVAQGLVVGGGKRQGAKVRNYTPEEVRQMHEYRATLEAGAAVAAVAAATPTDIAFLDYITGQAEKCFEEGDMAQWAELDYRFHAMLADASHNDRIRDALLLTLTESFFVFYIYASTKQLLSLDPSKIRERLEVFHQEHLDIVAAIKEKDVERARQSATRHMDKALERSVRVLASIPFES